MSGFDDARLAILARLQAGWTTTAILWLNDGRDYPRNAVGDAQPFVFLEVHNDAGRLRTFGKVGIRTAEQTGRIVVHVFTPIQMGLDVAGTWRGTLAQIFEEQQFSNVRGYIARDEAGHSKSDDGVYFRTSVTIPIDFWRLI